MLYIFISGETQNKQWSYTPRELSQYFLIVLEWRVQSVAVASILKNLSLSRDSLQWLCRI